MEKPLIGIAIRLHEITKPPANFTQPMFYASLPAEARPHDPQRSREGAHQGRGRAAGRNRGRRSHRVQKVRDGLCVYINRLLFVRRSLSSQLTKQPSLQSHFKYLR